MDEKLTAAITELAKQQGITVEELTDRALKNYLAISALSLKGMPELAAEEAGKWKEIAQLLIDKSGIG